MRQGLQLNTKLQQELRLTPQLRQSIEILRYSTMDLIEYIQEKSMENPVLEVEEKQNHDAIVVEDGNKANQLEKEIYAGTYETKRVSKRTDRDDEYSFLNFATKEETLVEHLIDQLNISFLNPKQKAIGLSIISSINENGYLCEDLSCVFLSFEANKEEILDVLSVIQTFDPPGIAARNLTECLMLQMDESRDLARAILEDNLEDLAANRLSKIAKNQGRSIQEISREVDYIKSLNPKPGMSFSSDTAMKYIIPDAKVELQGEGVSILMNDDYVPTVYTNEMYVPLMNSSDKEVAEYITEKVNAANWLMKSIEQRRSTIRRIVESIVQHQMEFFIKGQKYLMPMTQKQIAEELDIHESTVCRATSEKYIETPRGIYELKYFFTTTIDACSGTEDGFSSTSVKSYIQDIVSKEETKKPYSDEKIRKELLRHNIDISRRTVAKYREELGILNSRLRRTF